MASLETDRVTSERCGWGMPRGAAACGDGCPVSHSSKRASHGGAWPSHGPPAGAAVPGRSSATATLGQKHQQSQFCMAVSQGGDFADCLSSTVYYNFKLCGIKHNHWSSAHASTHRQCQSWQPHCHCSSAALGLTLGILSTGSRAVFNAVTRGPTTKVAAFA